MRYNNSDLKGVTSKKYSILKVGSDLLPEGGSNLGIKTMHSVQQRVSDILDAMGQASAVAQELRQPITSGAKLRMQDEHVVYLLIDRSSNGGLGSVVGMLKVGKKVNIMIYCAIYIMVGILGNRTTFNFENS